MAILFSEMFKIPQKHQCQILPDCVEPFLPKVSILSFLSGVPCCSLRLRAASISAFASEKTYFPVLRIAFGDFPRAPGSLLTVMAIQLLAPVSICYSHVQRPGVSAQHV